LRSSSSGAWSDTALVVDTRTNLFALEAFQRGALEVQDEGSQLLADLATTDLAADKPFVIDLCAGAGGKTLAIAARLGNRGRILATDVDGKKLEELRRRARRAGVSNAQAVTIDGTSGSPAALDGSRGKADVVLVDAPCSGIGALRRNPEARWRLRDQDIAEFATRQRAILENATRLLAPGGRLVYATCTLLRAENEAVVEAVLAANPELALVQLPVAGVGDRTFTVAPDTHGTDGFFAAVMVRTP
jgi:16S rRNA (cytosine967-C5)-methyltransferase